MEQADRPIDSSACDGAAKTLREALERGAAHEDELVRRELNAMVRDPHPFFRHVWEPTRVRLLPTERLLRLVARVSRD